MLYEDRAARLALRPRVGAPSWAGPPGWRTISVRC